MSTDSDHRWNRIEKLKRDVKGSAGSLGGAVLIGLLYFIFLVVAAYYVLYYAAELYSGIEGLSERILPYVYIFGTLVALLSALNHHYEKGGKARLSTGVGKVGGLMGYIWGVYRGLEDGMVLEDAVIDLTIDRILFLKLAILSLMALYFIFEYMVYSKEGEGPEERPGMRKTEEIDKRRPRLRRAEETGGKRKEKSDQRSEWVD